MYYKFLSVLFLLSIYLFCFSEIKAADDKFITVVNPVRGSDFFQLSNKKPVDNVKNQWVVIQKEGLSATWLIRPDVFLDKELIYFIKDFPESQEKGLFLEITPSWAKKAGVSYKENQNWHNAGSVFLTGYEIAQRHKLIDMAFASFKEVFGFYPKTVGAWWIDANSLVYMREKYEIVANMNVADQYSTDNYQVWGQYFSTPFYPAKRNALVPASGEDQKIGVVTIQWATRDPYNSYGNGVLDSTYSVQANDYANKKYHDLDINYFEKLVDIYLNNSYSTFGQVTIGLENDFSWEDFGGEYTKQLEIVSRLQKSGVKILTVSQFASSYVSLFPQVSPSQIIFAPDPLESGGFVMWLQNLKYRVGWFYNFKGSIVRDLRLYRDSFDEPCFEKRCDSLNLAMIENRNLDEVTFGDAWVIDEGKISDIKLTKTANGASISYTNQSGHKRTVEFLPNDVKIDSTPRPIQVVITEAIDAARNTSKIEYQFNFDLKNGLAKVLITQGKNLLVFVVFSTFLFYLPGLMFFKGWQLDRNTKFILAWVVGLSFFTLVSFGLGYLKVPWLIFVLPLISVMVVKKDIILPTFHWSVKHIILCLVILVGSATWLLTSVKNGLLYDYGIGFWGPHGHDAIWHMSLIASLHNGLHLQNPVFAGNILQNYHYFYNLLLAQVFLWTKIPVIDLYFRVFPVFMTLSVGAVTFVLAKEWLKTYSAGILAVFFLYFGGSFGWLLSYFKNGSLGGETAFWAQQSISTLINPPFAISILIFLAGLYLFLKITEQKDYARFNVIPLIILWGSLIEFKAYVGLLVLGALAGATLIEFIKRNFKMLEISLPIFLISFLVFLPNNSSSSSLLVFSPFWLVHSMIDSPDRVGWLRLTLARIVGIENGNWFKFLAAEGIGFSMFLLGNLGTRIIGFLGLIKLWPLKTFNLFLALFLTLSLLVPLLFIQTGANFNIVQFFYYALIVFNFFTAAVLVWVINRWRVVGLILVGLIVLLTIPTTWDTLHHYLPSRPPARISQFELEALEFLKKQPDGIVLTHFYDDKLKLRFMEPKPIFAYESTAYVSALTGKPEFIADTVNLEILGVDYKGRLQAQKDVMALRETEVVRRILQDNNISYIYVPKIYNFGADESRFGVKRIFNNEEVEIYRVIFDNI